MRPDKNTQIYTLVFSIVFLIIYALFTYLWKLLIRCVFVREENHQAEKIRELIQQSPNSGSSGNPG